MNENLFTDYCDTDNYYEEENNSDLESRLYANIHYASVENETPDETSDISKICSTNMENTSDTTILSSSEQHETSATNYTSNGKSTKHDVCQPLQQDKEVNHNEVNKTVNANSTKEISNINKDPYTFDANVEDQSNILPMKMRKKRKKCSQDMIKQQLLNFVFKAPNTVQHLSRVSNNNRNPPRNLNVKKNPTAKKNPDIQKNLDIQESSDVQERSDIQESSDVQESSNVQESPDIQKSPTSNKKCVEATQKEQGAENVFMKYQSSKQSLNKTYTEKHKEIEEMNTKYSVLEKKEKEKIQVAEHSQNANKDDSDSDSDQSILEVPIPPKPQPPLINLNDSDDDSASVTNDDTVTKAPLTIESCNTNDFRNQVRRALSKSQSELTSVNNSETLDNESVIEDIILNCTEVREGASSISEIRKMRNEAQNKKKSHVSKESTNDLQESAKIDNNKGRSERRNADTNSPSLSNKNKSRVDKVTTKERNKSTFFIEGTGNNESETNLVNMNVEFTEDVFPADAFIRSQNKLNANKKRQLECQQQSNNNVKRTKKSGESNQSEASTTNTRNKTQEKRGKSNDNSYFQPMTEKLKAFYTDSRGQENFDINEVQSKMSKDPRLWAILDEDLNPRSKRQRFWNVRCTHCQQDGHRRHDCPEPRRPPKCYMCGVEGHTEVRCPQKMCLTCGKSQGTFRKTCETCRTFYCTMCNAVGHKYTECPDLWRRYHQTTRTVNVNIPGNALGVMKPADRLFCCNCTKRGHDSSMCKDYRWSQHFPTPAFVSNYTDGPTYTEKQSQNMAAQCLSDANVVQFKNSANNGRSGNSLVTVQSSDDILPFPKELLKKKQSKKKAFPQNIPQLMWEDERNIAYVIYQCGDFYTIEDNGMEVTYTITARKGFNTYNIMECRVVPQFLEKLLELFRFEIKIYKEIGVAHEIVLRIRTFADLINDLCRFILYWLSLEDDEKEYVIFLNLPLERTAMIDIVNSQIRKLGTEMGNAQNLYNVIFSLKNLINNAHDQHQYNNTLRRIKATQFKLLMILNDHPKLRTVTDEIRKLVKVLEQSRSENVSLQQYLQILTVYNFLFVPHTPPKSFLTKYGQRSNPAVALAKCTQKKNSNKSISKVQTPVEHNSITSVATNNRAVNINNLQICQSVEVNSAQKGFQSDVTKKATESPRKHIRFDSNVNEDSISENDGISEYNNPSGAIMNQSENFNDFFSNRKIVQYDSESTSKDFVPINTSQKYTNITVNVLNKDQANTTDSLQSNANNSKDDESQNISKCTNITFNVSNKNRADTASNSKSVMDDSKNDKCQNANKYTNITVSVSNKNQAHTTTSFQSNVNNTENNKHQNSNKYTNITVSVSGKSQTHTAVSTASDLNSSKTYNLRNSQAGNSKNNQFDDDDVVCIEIKKKVPSNIKKQQANKQQKSENNNTNTKNLKMNKKKKKKIADRPAKQLKKAIDNSSRLKQVSKAIKKDLAICSSTNLDEWIRFVNKITSMVGPCQIPHLQKAAKVLKNNIQENTLPKQQEVYMLHRLVNIELQHQEEIKRFYKSFKPHPYKKMEKEAK